jgi:hypothetical protein
MSFGVDISDSTLKEPDKKDWINYKGIMMRKNEARARKAWDTMRKQQKKKSYNRTDKNEVRKKIINIIKMNTIEYSKILTLESPEFLFAKGLDNYDFYIAERDLKIYEQMKKINLDNVKFLYYGDIQDFSHIENIFDIIFLDFCCTYNNAEEIICELSPKIYNSKYFGFSFCLRKNKKELNDYKFDLISKIQKMLSELSIFGNLVFGESYRDTDHAPMVTLFFKNLSMDKKEQIEQNKKINKYDLMTTEELVNECKKRGLIGELQNKLTAFPIALKFMVEHNMTVDEAIKFLEHETVKKYDDTVMKSIKGATD